MSNLNKSIADAERSSSNKRLLVSEKESQWKILITTSDKKKHKNSSRYGSILHSCQTQDSPIRDKLHWQLKLLNMITQLDQLTATDSQFLIRKKHR